MARCCHAVGCSYCSFSGCNFMLLSVAAPARRGRTPVLISRIDSTVEAHSLNATSRQLVSSRCLYIQRLDRVSFVGILHCRPRLEHGRSSERRLNTCKMDPARGQNTTSSWVTYTGAVCMTVTVSEDMGRLRDKCESAHIRNLHLQLGHGCLAKRSSTLGTEMPANFL